MARSLFYDPHKKQDRTQSKYRADKKRDAKSKKDARVIVSEIIEKREALSENAREPEDVLRERRIEVRRQNRSYRTVRASYNRSKNSMKEKFESKKKKSLKKTSHNEPKLDFNFKIAGSRSLVKLDEIALVEAYKLCCHKIYKWRDEIASTVDAKKKSILAGQVEIQLDKRSDLLMIMRDKGIEVPD